MTTIDETGASKPTTGGAGGSDSDSPPAESTKKQTPTKNKTVAKKATTAAARKASAAGEAGKKQSEAAAESAPSRVAISAVQKKLEEMGMIDSGKNSSATAPSSRGFRLMVAVALVLFVAGVFFIRANSYQKTSYQTAAQEQVTPPETTVAEEIAVTGTVAEQPLPEESASAAPAEETAAKPMPAENPPPPTALYGQPQADATAQTGQPAGGSWGGPPPGMMPGRGGMRYYGFQPGMQMQPPPVNAPEAVVNPTQAGQAMYPMNAPMYYMAPVPNYPGYYYAIPAYPGGPAGNAVPQPAANPAATPEQPSDQEGDGNPQ